MFDVYLFLDRRVVVLIKEGEERLNKNTTVMRLKIWVIGVQIWEIYDWSFKNTPILLVLSTSDFHFKEKWVVILKHWLHRIQVQSNNCIENCQNLPIIGLWSLWFWTTVLNLFVFRNCSEYITCFKYYKYFAGFPRKPVFFFRFVKRVKYWWNTVAFVVATGCLFKEVL